MLMVKFMKSEVVVAQLIERALPTPGIHGSNPVIGTFYLQSTLFKSCIENTKIMKRRPVMAHLKNFVKIFTTVPMIRLLLFSVVKIGLTI